MIARLIDTSSWTYEQWLAAIIMAFIVITVVVFIYRIVTLFRFTRKPVYKPNLRPLRRTRLKPGAAGNENKTDDLNDD